MGTNLYVMSRMLPEAPTTAIWRGVMPFVAADILRMGVLIAYPAITLYLPGLLNP